MLLYTCGFLFNFRDNIRIKFICCVVDISYYLIRFISHLVIIVFDIHFRHVGVVYLIKMAGSPVYALAYLPFFITRFLVHVVVFDIAWMELFIWLSCLTVIPFNFIDGTSCPCYILSSLCVLYIDEHVFFRNTAFRLWFIPFLLFADKNLGWDLLTIASI